MLRDSDDVLARAVAHGELASICLALGRNHEALQHVQSELRLRPASLGSRQTMTSIFLAGVIAGALGSHEQGVMLTAAALAAYASEQFAPDEEETRSLDRLLADARAALGENAVEVAERTGRELDLEHSVEAALALAPATHTA